MENWIQLSDQRRLEIFQQVSNLLNLPAEAVEKDWWVTAALHALFSLPGAHAFVFKGGTSLSKCWRYLDRLKHQVGQVKILNQDKNLDKLS
jgi:predicted nucleotidyltransferase component of viral defense system